MQMGKAEGKVRCWIAVRAEHISSSAQEEPGERQVLPCFLWQEFFARDQK